MNLSHVRAVARQELLDLFRNRQVWISLLLQPIVFLAVMVFVGYIVEQRGAAFRTKEFKVVLSGDTRDLEVFETLLREHNFRATRVTDVQRPVVGGDAEIGIVVPKGSARDLDAGGRVAIELSYLENRDQSEVALARARVALAELGRDIAARRLDARGLPPDFAEPIEVTATGAGSTERGARVQLSKVLPGLLLLQSATLITTAAQRFSGRKEKRTLEPLLVLPLSRRDILLGSGFAAFVAGVIPALAFIVPIVVITILPIAFAAGLSSPFAVASTLLVGAPLVAAFMVAVGLLVGVLTRTGEGGSAVSSVAFVPVFAVAFLFMSVDSLPTGLSMYVLPVFGAALFTREAIVDGISLVPFLLTAVSTLVYVAALLALGSRSLETEGSVLRPAG